MSARYVLYTAKRSGSASIEVMLGALGIEHELKDATPWSDPPGPCFEELLDFLREAELDRVGAFAYSPVEGARANELPDPVSEELKEDRLERFMAVQAEISAAKLQRKLGRTLTVLVDEAGANGAVARSSADAPEIDGVVHIADGQGLKPGQFVQVVVEDADEHDLHARLAQPLLKVV